MAASAIFTGISAGASLASSFGQRAALKSEAKSLEFQARGEKLRGKQISVVRRDQLNQALATIDTIRVGRGLSLDSPGGVNIRRVNRRNSQTNENAEVLSSKFRETDIKTRAASKRRAAPFALISGFASTGASIAQEINRRDEIAAARSERILS
ncbi:MAG: hypothetical protein GXP04_12225 [Alphaproteobacteria bacterium]|nr:hypothetical protein [Alphaproteobacteria bacterium]